jgi:hypothetical protein
VTAAGLSKQDTTVVTVTDPPPTPGLAVTVKNSAGNPLVGADIIIIDAAGKRTSGMTGNDGVGHLQGLADGDYTVYAWLSGYLPGKVPATVMNNSGSVTISLAPGQVATASVTSTPLTYDQIIAAGPTRHRRTTRTSCSSPSICVHSVQSAPLDMQHLVASSARRSRE